MKVNLKTIRKMAMAGGFLLMEMSMRAIGRKAKCKVKGFIYFLIMIFIKESFKMIRYNTKKNP